LYLSPLVDALVRILARYDPDFVDTPSYASLLPLLRRSPCGPPVFLTFRLGHIDLAREFVVHPRCIPCAYINCPDGHRFRQSSVGLYPPFSLFACFQVFPRVYPRRLSATCNDKPSYRAVTSFALARQVSLLFSCFANYCCLSPPPRLISPPLSLRSAPPTSPPPTVSASTLLGSLSRLSFKSPLPSTYELTGAGPTDATSGCPRSLGINFVLVPLCSTKPHNNTKILSRFL
jgi:hypothetical protein